jgi:ornithine carbamoyltransferase
MSKLIGSSAVQPLLKSGTRSINLSAPSTTNKIPPHLLSLAQLSPHQISSLIAHSSDLKLTHRQYSPKHGLDAAKSPAHGKGLQGHIFEQSLKDRTVAVMFSKRSTRTRVASETAITSLGGHAMFLGPSDIQVRSRCCRTVLSTC